MSQFSFEQKIEILSKIALDYCNENGLKFKQYNQKFAQLIIEECINVASKYDAPKMSGPGLVIGSMIAEHFGVEE